MGAGGGRHPLGGVPKCDVVFVMSQQSIYAHCELHYIQNAEA